MAPTRSLHLISAVLLMSRTVLADCVGDEVCKRVVNSSSAMQLRVSQKQNITTPLSSEEILRSDHTGACTTTILTDVLTTKGNWQNGHQHVDANAEYFGKFYRSVLSIPGGRVHAIILHDSLPDEVVQNYTTADGSIEFVKVNPSHYESLLGVNDVRWPMIRDELRKRPDLNVVFMTDISDVQVKRNPCDLVLQSPHKLHVGSEKSGNSDQRNKWIESRFQDMGGKYKDWLDTVEDHHIEPFYNAGLVGGTRDEVIAFAERMSEVIGDPELTAKVDGKEINVNMGALMYILHAERDASAIFTGEPLHSNFKQYEDGRNDVYFIHKL